MLRHSIRTLVSACLLLAGSVGAGDEHPVAVSPTNLVQFPGAFDGNIIRFENGVVLIHGGEVVVETNEVPITGSVEASNLVGCITDPTCDHCRKLWRSMVDLQRNYGQELALVKLPGAKTKEGEEAQFLLYVAFRADPLAYKEISEAIYYEKSPPYPDVIRSNLVSRWGQDVFDAHFSRWHEPAQDLVQRALRTASINGLRIGSFVLPQLMLGNHVAAGVPEDARSYYSLLRDHLGMDPKYPVLKTLEGNVDLGRVFAGSLLGISIPMENTGTAPLILGSAMIPEGSTVTQHPGPGIQPGERKELGFNFQVPPNPGPFEYHMEIACNTFPSRTEIILKGEVWMPVTFEPPLIEIKNGRRTVTETRIHSEIPINIADPIPTLSNLTATIRQDPLEQQFTLTVVYSPGTNDAGLHQILIPVEGPPDMPAWPAPIQLPVRIE